MTPEQFNERLALAIVENEPPPEENEKKIDFENNPAAGRDLLSRFGFNGTPR